MDHQTIILCMAIGIIVLVIIVLAMFRHASTLERYIEGHEEEIARLERKSGEHYNNAKNQSERIGKLVKDLETSRTRINQLEQENIRLKREDTLAEMVLADIEKYGSMRDKETNLFMNTRDWIRKYYSKEL